MTAKKRARRTKPTLLTRGNPQIPKADGDAPVQDYIAAMPGWKRAIGEALDALIERQVPDVHKAVRWNTPFYGVSGQGWFLGINCCTKYVKVSWLNGTALDPQPPIALKQEHVRYWHVFEDDEIDHDAVASWVRQAAAVPGEPLF